MAVWWVDCEVCDVPAAGPFTEDVAVQVAGAHDDAHHQGQPTAEMYPDAGGTSAELMFGNCLIGGLPGSGKTFAALAAVFESWPCGLVVA